MNDIQINGQRRLGPPENWSGPPPVHGTEIFIKNLPKEVFELELYAIFSAVGIIYEVRLPVNWNGLNRGYAFIRFTSVSAADKAIDVFDNYEIRNSRKIKVARSVDNTRLFLSAVPIEKNAEQLKNDLLNYVENVKKVYVYPTLENRSVFRGYAFVEFETHRDAAIAKRILTPDVCHGIFEKKCVAAWANPLPFLDQSVLKSLNVLFIRNIPKDISGFHLKQIIENSTKEEIQRIKKLNDFAFLTFRDHKSAKNALNYLRNAPFVILDHETQAEWAVPKEMVASCADKKYEELSNLCTRSEDSSTFDFNGVFSDNVPYQNYPSFMNNPPSIQDRKNEIFGAGENRNCGLLKDETVFYANRLKNLNAHTRKQDTLDSRYSHLQGFENDIRHTHRSKVLSPLVTSENEYVFNSSCSNLSQPRNTLFHRTSPELYSPPVLPGCGFDKLERKSPGHINFFGKFMENVNIPFSNIMKSFENGAGIGGPLQRIHNSDSDSDESLMNLSRLGASPTSPSAVTNWSSGTASLTLSCDEQDVNSQSPMRQYYY